MTRAVGVQAPLRFEKPDNFTVTAYINEEIAERTNFFIMAASGNGANSNDSRSLVRKSVSWTPEPAPVGLRRSSSY
ncbi:MAG: hypothetical protein R2849_08005 [Thermomicrobiales bacterium]